MCGRSACTLDPQAAQKIVKATQFVDQDKYKKSYNVGPTRYQPVLISTGNDRQLMAMRWGLVPCWSKTSNPSPCLVNARSETVDQKNTFRRLVDRRRCVVVADGYFEWKRSGPSQGPYFFTPTVQIHTKVEQTAAHNHSIKKEPAVSQTTTNNTVEHSNDNGALKDLKDTKKTPFDPTDPPVLRMAALYDTWHDPETQEKMYSYTVLTVLASPLTETIHDRMPALLLSEEDVDAWLNPSIPFSQVKHLLQPSEQLTIWPVSEIVGNIRNDVIDCIKPIDRKNQQKKLITSFFKPTSKSASAPEPLPKTSAPDASAEKQQPSSLNSTISDMSESVTDIPDEWGTEYLNESLIDEDGMPLKTEPESEAAPRSKRKLPDTDDVYHNTKRVKKE